MACGTRGGRGVGRTARRCILILTAAALLTALTPASASAAVSTGRLAGADRYATAVEISKAEFPSGAPVVVIATGGTFPDALTGVCAAVAHGGPMLLVPKTLTPIVRNEIARLGAKKAIVLGGRNAVPAGVEASLASMGLQVLRVAGADRYATAAAIAGHIDGEIHGLGDTAIIATGSNFPDSLAGSPMSGFLTAPILLVGRDSIPNATKWALKAFGIKHTIVLGGPAAVSDRVLRQLPNPRRLGGANRYETMRIIGEYAETWGMGNIYMGVATGTNFPDALAGSVRCSYYAGVLVLTPPNTLCAPARRLLSTRKGALTRLEAYGGPRVVSPSVFSQATALVR